MATKKQAVKQAKVLNIFRANTAIGILASNLKDQKPHKLSTVLKGIKGVDNPKYRIQILRQTLKRKRVGNIDIDRKKDLIRMSLTARAKRATKPVVAKAPIQATQAVA